jgi:hypothetical protein
MEKYITEVSVIIVPKAGKILGHFGHWQGIKKKITAKSVIIHQNIKNSSMYFMLTAILITTVPQI